MNDSKATTRKATNALLIWDVPPKLRQDFKAACAKRGISMKEAVLNFLKGFAEEKE